MVTPDDIAVELGRATPVADPDLSQWDRWISDARLLISARLGDLTALDQDKLDYVVRQAVAAQAKHPDDATQVTVSVDDASTSRSYRSSSGRVTIIEDWWQLLAPSQSGKAFTIRPSTDGSCHLDWCSFSMGAAFCSCGVDVAGVPIFEGGCW